MGSMAWVQSERGCKSTIIPYPMAAGVAVDAMRRCERTVRARCITGESIIVGESSGAGREQPASRQTQKRCL